MNYIIKLHPNVKKFLDKCHKDLQDRITKKLKLLKQDPFRYLEHYEGEDCYKLRIGDYRALVDVNNAKKVIFIQVLKHRKNIYKTH